MEGTGKASRLHALYDWGATVTLVTHAAAVRAGLERKRQTPTAIAGLGGRCTMVNSYYMVPVIDGKDRVRVVKALSWRGPYHDVGGLERNRDCHEGFCGKTHPTSRRRGDAGRHGQSGLDAHARGEQPG